MYQELTRVLKQLDEIIFMKGKNIKNNIRDFKKKKNCISDGLLYSYLEGMVTEAEAIAIERHLNSCVNCFNELTSILKNSISPATELEEQEIAEMRTITAKEQVSKILSYHEQLNKKPATDKKVDNVIIKKIKRILKKIFENIILNKYYWRPAFAVLVFITSIVCIYQGVKYYNTDYQILRAENILLNNHRIYIESARLSGGYGSSGISVLMASDEDKPSFTEQAKSYIKKAIANGSKSLRAKQLLAQIFIIEHEDNMADSILIEIQKEPIISAALLNDSGVLLFQKKDWKNAADNFQAAIVINNNFLEAYYNLALVKMKLKKMDDAISILNKYIELEDDELWENAARHLISKGNMIREEMN